MRRDEPVASSPSLLSFRLPRTEAGTGGGRLGGARTGAISSSSESLSVRSITIGPDDVGGGGTCAVDLDIAGGDNSRLTSFSSSESDESAIVMVLAPLGAVDKGGGEGRSCFSVAAIDADGPVELPPCLCIHPAEPAFPSWVCHSASGSIMTSSSSSCTLSRISVMNLRCVSS